MKHFVADFHAGRIQAFFLILFLTLPMLVPLSHATVTKRMIGRVTYEVLPGDDITPDVDLADQGQQGQLHALFIAIDRYPGIPGGDLGLPVSDSRKIADALIHTFGVPQRNIQFLHDEQATREGIRRALNSLADTSRVTPYDQVLVMFSGHGLTIPNHAGDDIGFLVPYDAEVTLDGSNPEAVLRTCLPMDEMRRLARFLPARHTLFLADCCYGGLASLRSEPMSAPTLKQALSLRSIQIITAGSAEEEVLESPAWGGSAMTHLLLRLFNDQTRPEWQDRIITASEMGAYIKEELPRLVRGIAPSHRQTPQFERMEGMGEFFLARPEDTPRLLPPLRPPVNRAMVFPALPGSSLTWIYVSPNGRKSPAPSFRTGCSEPSPIMDL